MPTHIHKITTNTRVQRNNNNNNNSNSANNKKKEEVFLFVASRERRDGIRKEDDCLVITLQFYLRDLMRLEIER